MKPTLLFKFSFFIFFTLVYSAVGYSQSTSWKGTSSNAWKTAANWTNGVPSSTVDAIIGDANFTGPNQPTVTATGSCKSLTIGVTLAATLTVSKPLTIFGNLSVNANGTITHKGTNISIKGNWSNSGTYTNTSNSSLVNFIGLTQTLGGSANTNFRKITIGTGSTVTLTNNFTVSNTSSLLTVSGTLNPGESPTYTGTITALTVNSGAVLHVKAATFAGNYAVSGATTLNAGSIVDYSSITVNQTVSSTYTYATLKISGSGTKSLAANLPALRSTAAAEGNIYVNAGIFDLLGFTANRGVSTAGGVISVANNATLKIGGTNSFPTNYVTNTLVVASTVEYAGTNQTVTSLTYGNLTFSSSGGAAVKTLPGTALSVTGNLTSNLGAGTSVTYTALANITVNGSVNIGASTTFNAGSFAITAGGNWTNNGTFTGGTSTVTFNGPGTAISGTGVHNFNNITISASNITASASSSIAVAGNFSLTLGNFTQAAGGTVTMSGASKTISGTGIVFSNLTVSGSVTSSSTFTLTGNLAVSGTLTAGSSSITMNGASKTISGAGSITLGTLNATGSITTAISFSIGTSLTVSGSFTASAGTITFTGTSSLSGTANLYNVTLNGTSLQLSSDAVLGIANVYTVTAGTLNVTTTIPNTVNYNGGGAQNINAGTYCMLTVSGGNTKTAAGAITVNQNFTIAASTTFNAVSYTMTVYEDWNNSGTFTASTSTVQFMGSSTSNIYGATTFNILTINNTAASTQILLHSNVSAGTVNMTQGQILTGANTLTITAGRTGNGIILGTITRTQAFTTGTAYAFEGPDNTVTFSAVSSVTSITVAVTLGTISDFPFGASVSRLYNISVPAGTYNATLRLHYEDAELNGNTESTMSLWKYNGASWSSQNKTANNTTSNYVELNNLTDITNRWTCSDAAKVVQWNGSISSNWNTAANWTVITGSPSTPPSASDIVQIGTAAFTNQPTITTAATAKNIIFGSAQAAILTMGSGGTLTSGNIGGSWTADAVHTINVNNQTITVNGDLSLSNAVTNRTINVNVVAGTVNILGSLNQNSGANIIFSAAGSLNIGKDFIYTSGTFTASASTTTYNGTTDQEVAGVTYNYLTINKAGGLANINNNATIAADLLLQAGELDNFAITFLGGNATINSGTILRNFSHLHMQGNWTNNGTFIATGATMHVDGSGTQYITATTFNNFYINKPVGTSAILTGNVTVKSDLTIVSGTLNIGTYSCNRSTAGGIITVGSNATLIVTANNSPLNFTSGSLDPASTVIADGSSAQAIFGDIFGNLILRNGGAKTLASNITIAGNLTIESGVSFDASSYAIDLYGHWLNSGTFTPSTGTVRLYGTAKNVSGNTIFNRLTVYGSYTFLNNVTLNGLLNITSSGSLTGGGSIVTTMNSDLINSGILNTVGTTTFTGTTVQTLSLINAVSTVALTVNFNGTVAPVLNSTSTPQFGYLNINNTGGISPSVGWTVLYNMTVASGASFNGGPSTHTFTGSVTNNGNINSSGTLNFVPSGAATVNMGSNFSSTGTVIFGGSGLLTLAGSPASFQNVLISNTNAAGITASSNWTVTNNFSVNSNSIFNAGTYSFAVGGDVESNGTLNGGTSAFTMSGALNLLFGSPGTTFYDLIITGNIASQSSFNVSHNFTNNNLFDASIGVVDFTGSGASVIGGSSSPYVLSQIGIIKTSNAVVTLAANPITVGYLDIQSGILDMSTFSITEETGLGLLNIADNSTLKIGGSGTLPSFTTYAIDTFSTVDYAGIGQTVSNASNYGNLTISTAGNKTAAPALNIVNNFSLTNGTFLAGSFTHNLGGNWNMASGTFTNTGSTILLNGTATQDINSTGAFNNLTLNKTTGNTTLSSNVTVSGTLLFTLGKIQTGSNTLIIPSGATVTGAAQGTGWINGKLQKNFITGTSISRTMEIGDGTSYTPATVLIASVGTAGNLTASTTATDHANIATSGINSSRSVNRFFTFSNSGIVFTNTSITVNWVAADLDAGVTTSIFKAGNYSASSWTLPAVASALATSLQATGITAFGDIAVGELITTASWNGSVSNNWSTPGNWSSGAVPTASTNATIPTGLGTYPTISSGTVPVNNLIIQSGATLTVTGATLQIGGTITNSGTFTASSGTVELNGTTAQTIPAAAFVSNTIQNMVITNDVTIGGALIVSGTLSFGSISNKTLTTGGYLTLKSSATGTARVADLTNAGANSGNTISGNVTVERYIPANTNRAWRLLSVPATSSQSVNASWQNGQAPAVLGTAGRGTWITSNVASATSIGYDYQTNGNSMLTYNAAGDAWVGITSNTTSTGIATNSGYMLYIRGDRQATSSNATITATVLSTTGGLKQGAYPATPISVAAGQFGLIGNAYASQIDFRNVTKGAGIDNVFYVWDPKLSSLGAYQTVTKSGANYIISPGGGSYGSNGSVMNTIESGQAFFVHATTTDDFSFTETAKSTGSNVVFTPSTVGEQLVTNLYAGARLMDGTLNLFDNTYTNTVDNDDAKKLTNFAENIGLAREGKTLAIEKRNIIAASDTIFFTMTGMKQQPYQFEFIADNLNHPGLIGVLEDSYLNNSTVISLNGTTTVNFTVDANAGSAAAGRFRILFSIPAPLPVTFTSIKAYQTANDIEVEWKVDNQINIARYEIEKSTDGRSFGKVGTQTATGSNGGAATYKWLDVNAASGDNFYRVRSIGNGGDVKISAVVNVKIGKGNADVSIYPNPVTGKVMNVQFTNMAKGTYTMKLMNNIGQVVMSKQIIHTGGSASQTIAIDKTVSAGNYLMEMVGADNKKTVIALVVE